MTHISMVVIAATSSFRETLSIRAVHRYRPKADTPNNP